MTRIAVTSRSFSRHPLLRAELQARFSDITFNDAGASLAGPALIEFLRGHQRVILSLEVVDDALMTAVPELEVVAKYGVGLDTIDLTAMRRRGVRLGWTGGVNRRSVTELVISFAVALLRQVPQANAEVREGVWRQHLGRQLSDCTVGIIGCGHVGKDLARLLHAFGCRIMAHDILDFPEFYREFGIEAATLDDVLRQADVVTLHVPLDATTRGMLNAERLSLMKPQAILINAARGGLVDEDALHAMLESNRLAGAAFDVFATEPPNNGDLISLPNFIATPHIGGSSEEAVLAMGRAAIKGIWDNKVPEPGDECWPSVSD